MSYLPPSIELILAEDGVTCRSVCDSQTARLFLFFDQSHQSQFTLPSEYKTGQSGIMQVIPSRRSDLRFTNKFFSEPSAPLHDITYALNISRGSKNTLTRIPWKPQQKAEEEKDEKSDDETDYESDDEERRVARKKPHKVANPSDDAQMARWWSSSLEPIIGIDLSQTQDSDRIAQTIRAWTESCSKVSAGRPILIEQLIQGQWELYGGDSTYRSIHEDSPVYSKRWEEMTGGQYSSTEENHSVHLVFEWRTHSERPWTTAYKDTRLRLVEEREARALKKKEEHREGREYIVKKFLDALPSPED